MIGKFNINKAGGIESFKSVRQGDTSKAGDPSTLAKSSGTGNPARVDVSATASMLGSAMARMAELPEIREDVVASYKDMVDSGEYHRLNDAIAEAIIRDEA